MDGLRLLMKGWSVRAYVMAPGLLVGLAGCGTSGSTPSSSRTPVHTIAVRATAASTRHMSVPTATPQPRRATNQYVEFVHALCHSLVNRDAGAVTNDLPYYQYNTGLRYGMLGDGEGQTADPSVLASWLGTSKVQCKSYSTDIAGHGTILTVGWTNPGPSGLIETDLFNGAWKINDFTFGPSGQLYRAMQTSGPILAYRGR